MKQPRVKIAAAATLAALGGLAAVALNSNGAETAEVSANQAPAHVRTEVVRRTVTIHKTRAAAASGKQPAAAVGRTVLAGNSGSSADGSTPGRPPGEYEAETEHGGEIEAEHGEEVPDDHREDSGPEFEHDDVSGDEHGSSGDH
jgi:hypothetical protein